MILSVLYTLGTLGTRPHMFLLFLPEDATRQHMLSIGPQFVFAGSWAVAAAKH
jgi:hypothetical protein